MTCSTCGYPRWRGIAHASWCAAVRSEQFRFDAQFSTPGSLVGVSGAEPARSVPSGVADRATHLERAL